MKNRVFIYLCFILFGYCYGAIINIPGDYYTIQAGVDASIDGDTILIHPGTYTEGVELIVDKNIVIGSLFLTTGDSSYISQTIVDGNDESSVFTFQWYQDNTTLLTGLTIMNGWNDVVGGGIYCVSSSPTLSYLIVKYNNSGSGGSGMYLTNSEATLVNVVVTNNLNGGIKFQNSNITMTDCRITNNTGNIGFDIRYSTVEMTNISVLNHQSNRGIYCEHSDISISGGEISNNINTQLYSYDGGAIDLYYSFTYLSDVTINNNYTSGDGGGIYVFGDEDSGVEFDSLNRCNIYNNVSGNGYGNDIFSYVLMDVILDTFTVLIPTDEHTSPLGNFTFDILNGKIEQEIGDLYVSPTGSNSNSGFSPEDPLLTISYALGKIVANQQHPFTIYIDEGIYSPILTGEVYPLHLKSYVTLSGSGEDVTILDAAEDTLLMEGIYISGFVVRDLTARNGHTVPDWWGSGRSGCISIRRSDGLLENLIISGNEGWIAGGAYISSSDITIRNVTITDNKSGSSGGLSLSIGNYILTDVTISNNLAYRSAVDWYDAICGGGMSLIGSDAVLTDVAIIGNRIDSGGQYPHYKWGAGIFCYDSDPMLINVTISGNSISDLWMDDGGGLFLLDDSYATVVNSIIWGNIPNEVPDSMWYKIQSNYSDIGGNPNPGAGDIDSDPLFVNPASGDYTLSEGSPCIDAGTSFFILEGDTLVNIPDSLYNGLAPDMGAFESPYTAFVEEQTQLPKKFILYRNYPNPFNPVTTIRYDLPEQSHVTIVIYDILGREVKELVSGELVSGYHKVVWDATDSFGKPVGAGVYLYQIRTKGFTQTRKMLLLK